MEYKVTAAVVGLLLLLDLATGQFAKPRIWSMAEIGASLIATALAFAVRAAMVLGVTRGLTLLFPAWSGVLAGADFWAVFVAVFLVDDFANYWLHRAAHQWPLLWRLHKPHHTPTQLNVTAAVRENLFYYFLVPVNLMAPALIYMGAAKACAAAFVVKATLVYLQHANYRWDLYLRRFLTGRVLLDLAESVFVLQDFHHAHHGVGRYGNASSNYGNNLNIWDRMFGTSSGHPRRRQDALGLPVGVPVEPWTVQLFWPLVRSPAPKRREGARLVQSSEADLAAAPAVIHTADGLAVAVKH